MRRSGTIGLRPLTLALGACLIWAPPPALADNVVGVDKARAETIAGQLKPGDILIWNCPTCRGLKVMTVKQVRVLKYGSSVHFAVTIKRDVLISSRKTYESLAGMACADPILGDPDAEPDGWPVDLTYTYRKTGGDGPYAFIGRAVGVTNNPFPTISITAEALANINRCAAKHKRPANAPDNDRDPLLERLISKDEHIRSAAMTALRETLRAMSALAREQLMVGLIDETGDVGTVEEGPGNGERAGRALFEMGSVAAPYLLRTVLDKTEDVVIRDATARLLGRIHPTAQVTISGLMTTLDKEFRSPPRGGVAFALGETGIATDQVLQTLKRALAYRYSDIPGGIDLNSFTEIAIALKKLGADWRDAIPVLGRYLEGQNPYERVDAAVTLLALDPGSKMAVAVLIEILEDRTLSGPVHDQLLVSLRRAGPAAKEVVPTLIRILNDRDRLIDRGDLLEALEMTGTAEALEAVRRYKKEHPTGGR